MLISKFVEIKWNSKNKKHYQQKGYVYSKIGEFIYVKVEDLKEGSNVKVDVLCDYCKEKNIETIVKKSWENYLRERKHIKKDTCDICKYKKYKDVLKYKQENKLLTPSDNGYWTFKENRLKALKEYIKKYGKVTNMRNNIDGKALISTIENYGESPIILALELGYDIFDICNKLPSHYLDDWDKLKTLIEMLINKFNRFPTQNEIITELKIATKHIFRHGGMYEIKRKMNYIDEGDLIDDLGYYNSSSYEYILSQWLIHNSDVKINRNVIISSNPEIDGYYNCDFVLTSPSNNKIWVEIWGGYKKNTTSTKFKDYNYKHDVKIDLYNKYNYNLISLYPNFFDNKKYEDLQNDIYELFKDKIICKNKCIPDITKIIPYSILNEQELLEKVMSYSKDKNILPGTKFLHSKNDRLGREIDKRYGSLSLFAEHIGVEIKHKANNYWTKDKVFSIFCHMIKTYGKILNRTEINKIKDNDKIILDISHVISSINKSSINKIFKDGLFPLKLKFFEYCLNNNIEIPIVEIKWIHRIFINKTKRGNKLVNDDYQQLAKRILERYYELKNIENVINI